MGGDLVGAVPRRSRHGTLPDFCHSGEEPREPHTPTPPPHHLHPQKKRQRSSRFMCDVVAEEGVATDSDGRRLQAQRGEKQKESRRENE